MLRRPPLSTPLYSSSASDVYKRQAGARSFGDLGDPNSDVSRLVEERGGYDLMPELDYRPVNKYLPPREPKENILDNEEPFSIVSMADNVNNTHTADNSILKWVDTLLSR